MSKIIDFMRLCLQTKEIPLSWGISNIVILKGKVTFDVDASKYQGEIELTEKEQKIIVKLGDRNRSFLSSKDLLCWLDNSIE